MGILIRAANKPQLATTIWNQFNTVSFSKQGDWQNVFDGNALFQRLPWPGGLTYYKIYDLYFKYACQKHGTDSIVVFHGYTDMSSTNDTAYIGCS